MTTLIKPTVTLKPCPFCGGDAEMKLSACLMHKAIRINCVKCHSSSNLFMEARTVAFKGIPSGYVTLDECIEDAVRQWNRRTEKLCILGDDVTQKIGR